ncbi:hypothetical protein DFQ29_000210 [Apophysomyces sp. BC1021]|nr:hypothetical protein DFQ29_000210 [Apophysomyces sp. BC1021]
MDSLFKLFCVPNETSLDAPSIKNATFQELVKKTMAAASSLTKDDKLQDIAAKRMEFVLSSKSHSPANTLRTIRTMFEAAADACQSDQERHMIRWLQTCVASAVQMGLQEAVENNKVAKTTVKDKKESNPPTNGTKPTVKDKKEANPPVNDTKSTVPAKSKKKNNNLLVPEDDYVPTSDDEYLSKDEDDAVVPVKVKKGRKKRSDMNDLEQVVPDLEIAGGPTAVIKTFDITPSKTTEVSRVLRKAKDTIDACVYALTDDDVADALIAAKQRKVKIRIITDNQQAAGKGADAKRLQEDHGIPYKTETTTGYMHNKFAVIDNATLINGSFNWSKGARFKNRENIMITNLPGFINDFNRQFEALWNEF